MREKKTTKDQHVYRKLSVGVVKGQINKLSRLISSGAITDEQTINNSLIDIARDAYCRGYEQRVNERRLFKDKKQKRMDEEFKELITQIDDLTNKNQ